HDMANEAVASLALIAKLPNGGVALGLAAWAMQLTGPEIAWVWPFSVSSACEVPPAGVVCTVDVVDAELRTGWEVGSALLLEHAISVAAQTITATRRAPGFVIPIRLQTN